MAIDINNKTVSQQIFGGLDSEVNPSDLPEGLSPDNNDMIFVPGSAATRPGLSKLFSASLGNTAFTFIKTYVQPNNLPLNLFLSSDGRLLKEDVTSSPGTYSQLMRVEKNLFASSVSAFGREYIAFHDGLQGQDIPRQYDGTSVTRVTQDGPACVGGQLQAADAAASTIPISTIIPKAAATISSATNVNQVVTIVTTTPHGLSAADEVLVTGVSVYQYNGQQIVASVPSPNSFTYNVGATGWGNGTGGQAVPLKVSVATTINHGLISGETIVISGDSDPNYNNSTNPSTKVGLAAGAICRFYNMASNGQFNLNHPAPSPLATYTFQTFGGPPSGDTIMFNPDSPYATSLLPGLPTHSGYLADDHPMQVWGALDSNGSWNNNTSVIWSGANYNWGMSVCFNLIFPADGTYYFKMTHDDGAIIGMGGGITYVSGPLNDPAGHTSTAQLGLPLMGANNARANDSGNPPIWQDVIVVTVPAAGTYPCEIDYCQAGSGQVLVLQYSPDGGTTYKTIAPGSVAYATPPTWSVVDVTGPKSFTFDAVYAVGNGSGGIITVGGLVAPGIHKVAVSFLTDTGYITAPCPPVSWASAGNKRVVVSGLPIGPSNVKGRVCIFTGAGGDNFYYLLVPAIGPDGSAISTTTVVADNTSTSATFDFADLSLFGGVAADAPGNDLFAQIVLGQVGGMFSYAQRMLYWACSNNIQNLLNMGFEGGTAAVGGAIPLGWTVASGGGSLVDGIGDFGHGWQITGNGTSANLGMLTQPAYHDWENVAIVDTSTKYTFRCYAYVSQANMAGSLKAELYSATGGGVLASGSIAANTLGVGQANGAFVDLPFNAASPRVIPTDLILRVYATSLTNNASVVIDELQMIFTDEPVRKDVVYFSYIDNPEGVDGVTGILQPPSPEPIRTVTIIRDNLYIRSSQWLYKSADNGTGEPATWDIETIAPTGALSLRAADIGEGWDVAANDSGLYLFGGGVPRKVSQEIQSLWDSMPNNLKQQVWIKNDPIERRIYIGVPLTKYAPTGATYNPSAVNKVLVLDYREMNSAEEIEQNSPLHISLTGRTITSDLKRKWTMWNLSLFAAGLLSRPGATEVKMCFGSGLPTGIANGYGNVYLLDYSQYYDDDYGQIHSYYVTHFFVTRDQEDQLQLGPFRKLFNYMTYYIAGVGVLSITPYIDRLGNAPQRLPRDRTLSQTPGSDLENILNIRGERVAFKFSIDPLP